VAEADGAKHAGVRELARHGVRGERGRRHPGHRKLVEGRGVNNCGRTLCSCPGR